MACAEFFGLARYPSPQRPLPPLPYGARVDETCGTASTRVLKKQNPVRAAPADTRGAAGPVSCSTFITDYPVGLLTHVEQYDIYLHSQERHGRRKLKRTVGVVKTPASTSVSATR